MYRRLSRVPNFYRNFVTEVHRKTESVLNNQIKQPTAQVQSIGYDNSALLRELQEGFGAVRRDVSFAAQKINSMQQGSCPNVSCVSATMFILFAIVQIFILVGYFIYRLVRFLRGNFHFSILYVEFGSFSGITKAIRRKSFTR